MGKGRKVLTKTHEMCIVTRPELVKICLACACGAIKNPRENMEV
jgi:hypothetical protein